MDEGPRFFTVEEANALVPSLEIEFGRIARIRAELAPLIRSLGGAEAAVGVLQDESALPWGQEDEADLLRRLAAEITGAIERVNSLGCLVKDIELGLVDFYALQDDEPVFLCWQFGEPGVSHWHALDEGYSSRRPLSGFAPRPPAYLN
jgi:hypothetical protein